MIMVLVMLTIMEDFTQHSVKRPSKKSGEKPGAENYVEQDWTEKIKIKIHKQG